MSTATETRSEKLTRLNAEHADLLRQLEHAERAATPEQIAADRNGRLELLSRELSEAQRRPTKRTRQPAEVQADIDNIDAHYSGRAAYADVLRDRAAAIRQEITSLEKQPA